jgi:hypothetical protein
MKLPRWLQVVIILGIFGSCYVVYRQWGLVIAVAGVFGFWFYGRKELEMKKKFSIGYLTGLTQYPKPTTNMTLLIEKDGICLKQVFMPQVKILFKDISKIEAETRTQITRTASMFKGAAGLVLAGPLGAMVGMGIGSKHDDSQYFVSVIFKDELGEDNILVLQQKGILSSQLGNAFEVTAAIKEARKEYLLKNKK